MVWPLPVWHLAEWPKDDELRRTFQCLQCREVQRQVHKGNRWKPLLSRMKDNKLWKDTEKQRKDQRGKIWIVRKESKLVDVYIGRERRMTQSVPRGWFGHMGHAY